MNARNIIIGSALIGAIASTHYPDPLFMLITGAIGASLWMEGYHSGTLDTSDTHAPLAACNSLLVESLRILEDEGAIRRFEERTGLDPYEIPMFSRDE